MTLPAFGYASPTAVAEAVDLLGDPAACVLAGGHSVIYRMKTGHRAASTLVDLRRIEELRGVRPDGSGGVEVGAMTTIAELVAMPELARWQPACAQAVTQLGDPQLRNRATVGGNLVAGAAPGGPALRTDLPAVLLAAAGTVTLVGPDGGRDVAAEDFFDPKGAMVAPAEVLVRMTLPGKAEGWVGGYQKFRDRAGLAPVCAVAVEARLDGRGAVAECRIGLTGAVARAVRLTELEQALVGIRATDAGLRAARLPRVAPSLFLDRRGTGAEYLSGLTAVLVRRALVRAAGATGSNEAASNGATGAGSSNGSSPQEEQ